MYPVSHPFLLYMASSEDRIKASVIPYYIGSKQRIYGYSTVCWHILKSRNHRESKPRQDFLLDHSYNREQVHSLTKHIFNRTIVHFDIKGIIAYSLKCFIFGLEDKLNYSIWAIIDAMNRLLYKIINSLNYLLNFLFQVD